MYRDISKEELKKIIEDHQHFLNRDVPDWENRRAKFERIDLADRNFSNVNLDGAIFDCVLMCGARFENSSMKHVDFEYCDLLGAEFPNTNLTDAAFRNVDLRDSDFRYANLKDVTLHNCCFYDAGFENAINVPYLPLACPSSGSFIGWTKCSNKIVKLKILEDAKRSSGTTEECRCDAAKVLAIENCDGSPSPYNTINSDYDPSLFYTVGEIVRVPNFDTDRWKDRAAPGIYFFIDRQFAVEY